MDEDATQKNLGRMAKVVEMTPFMRHLGMEFVEGSEATRGSSCGTSTRTQPWVRRSTAAPSPR
jgi:hypothetical protein